MPDTPKQGRGNVVADNPKSIRWDDAIVEAWRPRIRIPVSLWADRFRLLHAKYSAEAGPYRTSRVPYLAEFMDAFCDPTIALITFTKAARIGGTEAANNMLGFAIDQEPGPLLYVYPTKDDAEEEATDRLIPFIEGSPRLRAHCPHPGWGTKGELRLDSMNVYMAWAKAPRTLVRRTARYVMIDELDNCDRQEGSLGDTLSLARKRVITFRDRAKVIIVSTPTNEEGGVYRTYQESDKRQYHVPCPHCGTYQILAFDRLRVPSGQRDPDVIEIDGLAWFSCRHCEKEIREPIKTWMIERGIWVRDGETIIERLPINDDAIVARARFNHVNRWTPQISGSAKRTKIAGFQISALYSPFVAWSQVMAEWFRSDAELKKGNPEPMRVFVNSMLGEPWRESAQEVKAEALERKREESSYVSMQLPADVMALVAGADVQADRIYYTIRGWGMQRRSYLVANGICITLEELHAICCQAFPRPGTKEMLYVDCVAVDSAYRTFEVYEFSRTHPGVIPVRGQQTMDAPYRPRTIQYSAPGMGAPAKVILWHINTSTWKDAICRAIQIEAGQPGSWHVPMDVSDDYLKQIASERSVWKIVTKGSSRRKILVWEPKTPHAANHYLDTEVYAMAMAARRQMLNIQGPVQTPQPEMPETQRQALTEIQKAAKKSLRPLADHPMRRSRTRRPL